MDIDCNTSRYRLRSTFTGPQLIRSHERHWTAIKHMYRYLKGTTDKGLFFPKEQTESRLIGFADASYVSDFNDARSQSGYVFLYGKTAISWKTSKQTLTMLSSTHAELYALCEATRESLHLSRLLTETYQQCKRPIATLII